MLNVFRENLKSLKWVLWLVAIAMTLYLGSYFFGDQGGGARAWAARIDGDEIPAQDLYNVTRNLDSQYRQLFGQNYDSQMRASLQLGTRAVQTLIEREIILDDARRLGLRVTPEDVAGTIRGNPAFQDEQGNFIGSERYQQLFAQRGGYAAFEASLADDLLIQRWTALIGQSVTVSDYEVEKLFRERTEKTALDYVVVQTADQEIDDTLADADVARWYEEHPEEFQREERRRIRYVVVEREAQRAKVQITDEEVAAFYQANSANYDYPEQRRASHILFRVGPDASDEEKAQVRQQAEAALARAQAGEEFELLARELSQDSVTQERGGDLGFFGRGQMVPAFDEAAFGTPPGQLAPVVETQFGFHVLQVTEAREAGVTPLDEVSDAIRRSLETRRAQETTESEADRLSQSVGTADRLAEVAATEGLEVRTLLVSRDDPLPDLNPSPEFLTTVFELETAQTSSPLRVLSGMAVVAVDEVLPPGLASLDEVETEVRSAILNERGREAALAAAEAALNDAGNLADAAAALGLEPQDSGDLGPTSDLPAAGGLTPEVRELLFGDAVLPGDRGVVRVPAGALIYEVSRREPFDPDRLATDRPDLERELRTREENLLQTAMLERLRESKEIEVNEELVNRFNG